MKKYTVVIRSISGKLMFVNTFEGKRDTNRYANEFVDIGCQVSIFKESVFLTADNLDEERELAGVRKLL
jgi:hypothetical protein